MADNIPPPPAGFTLDTPSSSNIPPPPPGFKLDKPSSYDPDFMAQAVRPVLSIPRDIGQEFSSGASLVRQGSSELGTGVVPTAVGAGKMLLGGYQELASPVTGTARALVGDPLRAQFAPGSKVGEVVGSTGEGLAALAAPGAIIRPLAESGASLAGTATKAGGALAKSLTSDAVKTAQGTISEVGPVSDASTLGSKMYSKLKDRLNTIVKERSKDAAKLKEAYRIAGIKQEREIGEAYRDYIYKTAAEKARDLPPDFKTEMQKSLDRVGDDPSIERLVTEKSDLLDKAEDINEASGEKKKLLNDMGHTLDRLIKEKLPEYQTFSQKYAEMSRDINLFKQTALGKAVTKKLDYLPDTPGVDPATLPGKFFQTKHSVSILREISGGDEEFVNGAASEYVASQLKDKSAKEARAWLTKQEETGWMDEVRDVKEETEKYVANLEKATHTQERVDVMKKAALKGAVSGAAGATGWYSLKHFLGL